VAVAHDANTRWPTTNGVSGTNSVDTTTGDRTFTHTPTGTPKGVVVCILSTGTTATFTGVLYGGVAMTAKTSATDTSEAGRVDIYTLTDSASIPTGAQTVTVQGCTATGKWATCSTVTAATNGTTVNQSGATNTTTAANPTQSLTTSAAAMGYAAMHSGAAAPATAMTTGTLQHSNDYGALMANTGRSTSEVAAGTLTITFTVASDDYCIAAVALAETTVVSVNPPPHAVMARTAA
jgi:hypothetical protein